MRHGSANSGQAGSMGCTKQRQPEEATSIAPSSDAASPRQRPCCAMSVMPRAGDESLAPSAERILPRILRRAPQLPKLARTGYLVASSTFGVDGRLAEWEGQGGDIGAKRNERMLTVGGSVQVGGTKRKLPGLPFRARQALTEHEAAN